MDHICDPTVRHQQLYQLFKNPDADRKNQIEWCTICGGITRNHKHFVSEDPSTFLSQNRLPGVVTINPRVMAMGIDMHFQEDCTNVGGGGPDEKLKHIMGLLEYACLLQRDIGKITVKEARDELILAAWRAPLTMSKAMVDRRIKTTREDKKFTFNCEFLKDKDPATAAAETAAAEVVAPDIPPPGDLVLPKSEQVADKDHMCDFGYEDDGRKLWKFTHIQEDRSVLPHGVEGVCLADIIGAYKNVDVSKKIMCQLDGDGKCTGEFHPVELRHIIDNESFDTEEKKQEAEEFFNYYRKFFNKSNAVRAGKRKSGNRKTHRMFKLKGRKRKTHRMFKLKGGNDVPSLLHPLDLNTIKCAPPDKKAGKRKRTIRKNKKKSMRSSFHK
jgi:hypothetical protein